MPVANKLVQMIKDNKKELLALKTSCTHGLGSASFYTASDMYDFTVLPPYLDNYLVIRVGVPADLGYSPYCQCYISNAQYFQPTSITYDENNAEMVFRYRSYLNNVTIRVYAKVICAVPIESLTIEAGGPV